MILFDVLTYSLILLLLFSRCNVAALEMLNTKSVSKMELVQQLVSTLIRFSVRTQRSRSAWRQKGKASYFLGSHYFVIRCAEVLVVVWDYLTI